jgi:hypothetical protein
VTHEVSNGILESGNMFPESLVCTYYSLFYQSINIEIPLL